MGYKSFRDRAIEQSEEYSEEDLRWMRDAVEDDYYDMQKYEIEMEDYYYTYAQSEAFLEFQERINSLKTYLEMTNRYVEQYISWQKKKLDATEQNDATAEFLDVQTDAFLNVKDYFTQFTFMSINSILFSVFETTLNKIAEAVSREEGMPLKFEGKNIPYINRYLMFIQDPLELELEREIWDKLNFIRKIRNKMIHSLSKDIQSFMNNKLKKILDYDFSVDNKEIDYKFTVTSFEIVCETIERIEDAFIKKYPNHGF